jgi:predicted phage tail protein
MIRTIYLDGALGAKYGTQFELEVDTIPEAVRALSMQLKGLKEDIESGSFFISRGSLDIGAEMLGVTLGNTKEVRITPVLEGSKNSGVGKVIIGVLIIAAAFFTAGASLAAMGAVSVMGVSMTSVAMYGLAIAVGGIAQMLAPTPNVGDYGSREKDEKQSFLFNGAANTVEQGGAVPLIYGTKIRTGSVVISAGLSVEQIAV